MKLNVIFLSPRRDNIVPDYRRMFGGARAVCYEWDACSDSLSGMKDVVNTYFGYPKDVFKFYKSAEIHTKQSFKIPLWFALPFLGLALGLYFVPKAYNTLHGGISGQGVGVKVLARQLRPFLLLFLCLCLRNTWQAGRLHRRPQVCSRP